MNIALALLSGVLVVFSFPTILFGWHAPELGSLGWVALVPLFVAIAGASPRRAFVLTFLTGLVWFGGSQYWIYLAVSVYGGLGTGVSVMVAVLLAILMSSFIAVASFMAAWIGRRWRGEMIVFMSVAWVALEYARAHVPFGGFPWSNVAMSQWRMLVPLQIVDLVGVYGLIFVMVWVNWYIAELVLKLRGREVNYVLPKLIITVLLIGSTIAYGVVRLNAFSDAEALGDETISIGSIQGNISQDEKWNPRFKRRNLDVHRHAAEKLFHAGADLIIWPEASYPELIWEKVTSADPRALGLQEEVVGTLPAVLVGALLHSEGETAYNSALLFNAKGQRIGRYDKSHLVPFGEYVPNRNILFFAKKLVAPVGDFRAGTTVEPLVFEKAKLGPLICYEDVFPEISRDLVLKGATILVNLTNDAWYGVTSAPYQHLALSVFRAVENRRYMVRSTNTGVSAIISPAGEVVMESPLFERSVMVGAVTPVDELSPYTRHGDWFAYACIAYTLLGLIISVVVGMRKRAAVSKE